MISAFDSPEKEKEECLCVSTHELNHLLGEYTSHYNAACSIISALRKHGIHANIVVGGFQLSVSSSNRDAATTVLHTFGIDLVQLGSQTFRQQLSEKGSLDRLAAEDHLGFGAKVLKRITGERN